MRESIEELLARSESKRKSESALRAAFHRACSSHYISTVLPELRRFEQHLKKQDVLVAISPIERIGKYVLQAGLLIEYPVDTTNLLEVRYDFIRQNLAFSQLFAGHRNKLPDYQFAFESFSEVTSLQLYDIVEAFVTSALALQVERRTPRPR